MMYGLDLLGLARFKQEARDAFPSGYALGVFSDTFGDSMPYVRQIVQSGKCRALRVQLMWSDEHAFSDKDIPKLKKEAKRWGDFAKHASVPVYLSPFCEHKVMNPDKYLQIVKEQAPNCEPVNSFYTGAKSSKFINEVHGTTSPSLSGRYIFSYDGTDMLESDIEAMKMRHKNALIWFGWTANFNGNLEVDKDAPKIPREKRTAWPSAKLIKSMKYVMDNPKTSVRLPAQWLWKSHAEDKGIADSRTNKPVLIAPIKAASAELLKNGRVVATAPYYGLFADGRSRYYFPEWGYETGLKYGTALNVRVAGKVYGTVNPAFREGVFHK